MKKFLALLLVLVLALSLAACGGGGETESPAAETYEIAMITDIGTIDDKSFNVSVN